MVLATAACDKVVVKDVKDQGGDHDVEQAYYYVAPTGNDLNPCSEKQPCRTLNKVNNVVQPGDLVYMRGGVYRSLTNLTTSGTSANPITYAAHPGETVILGGSYERPSADGPAMLRVLRASWITIRGIEIRESPQKGLLIIGGDHIRVENVVSHDNHGTGFQVTDYGTFNTFSKVASYNNYEPWANGGNSDGIACSSGGNTTIRDSVFYTNSDDGIDLWECTHNTVTRTISYHNGYGPEQGNGDGFKLGPGGLNTVINCIAYNNRKRGFFWNGATRTNTIYNNTAWNNGDNGPNFNFAGGNHILKNNISYQGSVKIAGAVRDSHNTWNLEIANPRFASTNPGSANFLELTPGSPAIDVGKKVGISYVGGAPDLGALEYRWKVK